MANEGLQYEPCITPEAVEAFWIEHKRQLEQVNERDRLRKRWPETSPDEVQV